MADTEKNGAEKTGAEKNGAEKNGAKKNGAEKNGAEKNDAEGAIPANDAAFLLACLQNVSGGSIAIDAAAVGSILGYKNPKSVSNRITAMKKKYNLPFNSGNPKGAAAEGSGRKVSGAAAPASPDAKVPVTPSKNRVTKPRAASTKKAATPKTPKGAKGKGKGKAENVEEDDDATQIEGDEEMSDGGPTKSDDEDDPVKDAPDNEEETVVAAA